MTAVLWCRRCPDGSLFKDVQPIEGVGKEEMSCDSRTNCQESDEHDAGGCDCEATSQQIQALTEVCVSHVCVREAKDEDDAGAGVARGAERELVSSPSSSLPQTQPQKKVYVSYAHLPVIKAVTRKVSWVRINPDTGEADVGTSHTIPQEVPTDSRSIVDDAKDDGGRSIVGDTGEEKLLDSLQETDQNKRKVVVDAEDGKREGSVRSSNGDAAGKDYEGTHQAERRVEHSRRGNVVHGTSALDRGVVECAGLVVADRGGADILGVKVSRVDTLRADQSVRWGVEGGVSALKRVQERDLLYPGHCWGDGEGDVDDEEEREIAEAMRRYVCVCKRAIVLVLDD